MTQATLSQSTLPPTWRSWIQTNLKRSCTANSLISVMVKRDFPEDVAARFIQEIEQELSTDQPVTTASASSKPYVYEASRLPTGNTLEFEGRQFPVRIRMERPEVLLVGNFMTPDECAKLRELASPKLARSRTVDRETGAAIEIASRTSSGAFFRLGENEFIANLERRLAWLTNWPAKQAEGLQVLRYGPNAEYKPHFDYFPPEKQGSVVHTRGMGQRTGTVIMYLNNVERGGATIFPKIHLAVTPREGDALYFGYSNSQGQLDELSLHGGAPVEEGEKWIATKWNREREFVPAPPAADVTKE